MNTKTIIILRSTVCGTELLFEQTVFRDKREQRGYMQFVKKLWYYVRGGVKPEFSFSTKLIT